MFASQNGGGQTLLSEDTVIPGLHTTRSHQGEGDIGGHSQMNPKMENKRPLEFH